MKLETTYMGLALKNPLVVSACPLSESVEAVVRMEEAGAGAVVMFSLFEEQLHHESAALEHFLERGTHSTPEALSYFPLPARTFRVGPERYLELLRQATSRVEIPVIASLNGSTRAGWLEFARQMEQAGAAGIELNLYALPTDPDLPGSAVERQYLEVVRAVKEAVGVPVAVKLSPFFSSPAHMAKQFAQAGADALVLFNRFYQPDFDLETLDVSPALTLSTPEEIRLPLRWIAILYGRIPVSLAATGGVHGGTEVVKFLLAGADAVMTASALLQRGIEHLKVLREELVRWLEEREYASVEQLKGSMSQQHVADPGAFERANYIKLLEGYRGAETV